MPGPILLIHGGAGGSAASPRDSTKDEASRRALAAALRAGFEALGESALAAVEAAVRSLEDSGLFNAGRGSVMTADHRHECDAAIMDGATLAAGAVASVRCLKNPISAARAVMREGRHVLLVGAGAEDFSRARRADVIDESYYTITKPLDTNHGTVGAVALDRNGRLAVATSTGGTGSKAPGRVGDSPLIGAGTFADRRCAISATGTGEHFIRTVFAHNVATRSGALANAAQAGLAEVSAIGGEGGCIAIDGDGNFTMPFTTHLMCRGWIDEDGEPRVAIYRDDAL